MADITESAVWEDSVYELATTDPVKGGTPVIGVDGSVVSGHANVQAQKLANRTKYLKQRVDAWPEKVDAAGVALGLVTAHNNNPNAHIQLTQLVVDESSKAALEANKAALEADRAELAASAAMVSGKIYPDTITGLAATTNDQYFTVPSPDSNEYLILYKNDVGDALEIKRYPSAALVDFLRGTEPAGPVPQFFESLDPEIAPTIIISPTGKVVAELPDPRVGSLVETAVVSGFYETLDPEVSGVLILSAGGNQVAAIGSEAERLAALETEIQAARGSRSVLADRLDAGLTPYGDHLGAMFNVESMAESHIRLYRIKAGITTEQLVIVLIGDSYIDGTAYWVENFAKQMQTEFGNAGAGFVGFGWWAANSGTWTAGSQPTGISGATRRDIVYLVQIIGTWGCTYNSASTSAPALYRINSSEIGAYVRFNLPSGHTAARLFYSGDGTGAVSVSWDDGSTWSTDIALTGNPSGYADLTGVPSGAATVRIKVVSGNVGLCGVDLRSDAAGVRINRLGASGSQTAQWANVDPAQWGNQLAAFGANAIGVLLGTNDQIFSVQPDTSKSRMVTIINNIKSACPVADVWQICAAENANTPKAYVMPLYTAQFRKVAVDGGHGFVDLQQSFGNPANAAEQYKFGSLRPLLDADNVHPSTRGGYAIAAANYRLLTN